MFHLNQGKLMKKLGEGNYFGSHYQKNTYNGFVVTDTEYTHAKVDWHHHENPYFTYLLQGKLFEANKKSEYYLKPGELLFHNWQDAHYNIKPDEYTRGFHLEFDKSWFLKHDIDIDTFEGSFKIVDPAVKSSINALFLEQKIQDDKSSISIESLALSIFDQFSQENKLRNKSHPRWFKRLKEYIIDSEEHFTLASLAKTLNIHPVHLSREFHKHFNITLGQYTRYLRVNKAVSLLLNRKRTMAEIGCACGFYDQSHFIRDFKRIYNRTPKSYLQTVIASVDTGSRA